MSEPVLFGLPLHLMLLYFIIYSCLGWCMETVYCSVIERRFVPRGFLLGPICPIYGVGVLMMICWFAPFMGNPLLFYVIAVVCMSAWEYLVGWFLEVTTHVKYWDYSMFRFNLHGRICLWVCLTWGVLAYLILFWVHPPVARLVLRIPLTARYVLTCVLTVLLLADTVTTIRKLALTARLLRKLNAARLHLSAGRSDLEKLLQQAKDGLTDKLNAAVQEGKEYAAKLQTTYNELLSKTERHSRRFRRRYQMSSHRYELDLTALREKGAQLRQHLELLRKKSTERKK